MNPPQKKNWWSRNWKWSVPVGCLSGLVLVIGFIALISGIMKSSDAYKQAIAKVKTNPAVVNVLGEPIKEGYFLSGSIKLSGKSGNANLAIPISGPKGKGVVYIVARKSSGEWSFSTLVVEIEQTNQRVNLLDDNTK